IDAGFGFVYIEIGEGSQVINFSQAFLLQEGRVIVCGAGKVAEFHAALSAFKKIVVRFAAVYGFGEVGFASFPVPYLFLDVGPQSPRFGVGFALKFERLVQIMERAFIVLGLQIGQGAIFKINRLFVFGNSPRIIGDGFGKILGQRIAHAAIIKNFGVGGIEFYGF